MTGLTRNAGSIVGMGQVMLAAALWATVGVATRIVPDASLLSASVLGLARMAFGGLAILCIACLATPDLFRALRRLSPGRLVEFALSSAVFQVCLFQSFVLLGVTTTVVVTVCLPPLISAATLQLRGVCPLSRGTVLALGLAVSGVVVFGSGELSGTISGTRLAGMGVAVLAAVAFVRMSSAARVLTREAGPLVVAGVGLSLASLVLAASLPMTGLQAPLAAAPVTGPMIALVLYLGLGPTALAYLLYCSGIAKCRSTSVGLTASMLEPAIAALLAYALLHETLSAQEVIGCGLIFLGMLSLWWTERRAPAVVPPGGPVDGQQDRQRYLLKDPLGQDPRQAALVPGNG